MVIAVLAEQTERRNGGLNMPNMRLDKNPMPEQCPNVRNKNFLEVTTGYTEEMAIDEAQRCLKRPTRRLRKQMLFRLSAAEFVRRKNSASQSA